MPRKDVPSVQVILDIPELLARVENDRELLRELLEIFKQECPSLLRVLEEAVARQDMKSIEKTGHTLKGMFATLSASGASSAASTLEHMGRHEEKAGLGEALIVLQSQVAALLGELDTCLG
jgi:HPt (histidine-containing phosphotransfer) domain-containing protein